MSALPAERVVERAKDTGWKDVIKRSNAFETRSTRKRPPPPLRPCRWCNTEFRPKRENPKEPAKSCSPECRSAAWRAEQKEKNNLASLERRVASIEARLDQILGGGK